MKSYSKPLLAKSNQSYENVQLESGDCPGGYSSVCDAIKTDLGYQCSKHTFFYKKDDCDFYKHGKCTYNWD